MVAAAENSKPVATSIKRVRSSRKLERGEVARALGISSTDLIAFEEGKRLPGRAFIKLLAKYYGVPTYFFYVDDFPIFEQALPDFRGSKVRPAKLLGTLASSVSQASEIRDVIAEGLSGGSNATTTKWKDLPSLAGLTSTGDAASALRDFFNLSERPASSFSDAMQYMYWLRTSIDRAGVVTVFDSLGTEDGRGYCLAHDNRIPYILINTINQIQESRIFTLLHEFVHVCLRMSGVSDPFSTQNEVEKFCNSVTAKTLMPKSQYVAAASDIAKKASNRVFVESLASTFKVSLQASALRAEQTGVKPKGFYREWMQQYKTPFNQQVNYNPEKIIRRTKDEGKKKLAFYGTTLPILFHDFVERRFISSLDVYRISGLKPRYLSATYTAANQRIKELGLNG